MTTKPLVIYHDNCPDGFTAAWVAARALGDVELFPGRYGDPPPLERSADRDVYIVDFSYPRDQLAALMRHARSTTVLDHHKTAQEELRGLAEEEGGAGDVVVFDMDRSGATLAWGHFHPGVSRPWIVSYVEDRDLWRFELEHSRELSLWIRCAPHTLEAWDAMAAMPLEAALGEAMGCKRYLDHYVADALRNAYEVTINYGPDSERAIAVNVSYTGISDVLNDALERSGLRVAIGWHVSAESDLFCSLRSVPGFDCSAIARDFGGGGHAQASGFRLPIDSRADLAAQLLRIQPADPYEQIVDDLVERRS